MPEELTPEEHKQRHVELHKAFDELLADFINHTYAGLSNTTLMEFLRWSYSQTENPTEPEEL